MILIVEDYESLAKIYSDSLTSRGFPSEYVLSGLDALRVMKERKPDLMIVDLALPDTDGVQLVLEARLRGYDGPAIAMSGADALMSDDKLEPAGFILRLQKPMTLNELVEAVSQFLTPKEEV